MHTSAMWWTLDDDIALQYTKDDLQGGMLGIANLLRILLPFSLMCSSGDIAVHYQVKCPFTEKPTIIIYDNVPGGIGLAEKAYRMRDVLLIQALQALNDCSCKEGCPSCVGPVSIIGENGKRIAREILTRMTEPGREETDAES
ncbi:MAG: hypothetical protein CW338_08270 [Clostridiales bacterium]|nr:hypothetical protein [Clostridiales bacterium]